MTERTAAETERPGGGQTLVDLAEVKRAVGDALDPFYDHEETDFTADEVHGAILRGLNKVQQSASESAIIPCTFPSCISAQTAAKAGEEIARLKGEVADSDRRRGNTLRENAQLREGIAALKAELSNLIAATKGQTFFHSDEAVNAEMGRLRGELAASEKCCSDCEEKQMGVNADTYQRGVEEGIKLACEAAENVPTTVSVHVNSHDASIATRCKEAIVMAISAAASPAPQKNTAECQEVCEWLKKGEVVATNCGISTECPPWVQVTQCPWCGNKVVVSNG